MKHLKKANDCFKTYSEEEQNELLQMAKTKKKEKEKQYQKRNKIAIASRMAKRYADHKDKILEKYQDNKTDYSRKFLDYERRNPVKIAKRKANYYQEKKEILAKKRQEIKAAKPKSEEENATFNGNEQTRAGYSFKRKAIDFTMEDLEGDAEDPDDEEYHADVEDLEKKCLPSRECKN